MIDKPKQQTPNREPFLSKLTEQIKSPRAKIAAAAGASILTLAIASKWLLPNSIGYLPLASPPFLAVIFEAVYTKHPRSKVCTTWYWILAIVLATALVIGLQLL